ncbi:MAG: T9SS type A sorting domain-containing protein, partial [Bacteroidia bacterium]|nr:T9SS type A sorting domain-containing protein [Bacteroidia bacterium]
VTISNQATTLPTNVYNWRFGDGGRSSDVTPTYKYSADVDSFEICLAIINNAGCISEHCEKVAVDLVGVENVAANDIFDVYPNPNAGVFNVKVNNPESNLHISIMDATGKTIKMVDVDASGNYSVDISDVSAGVYMVQVVNGDFSAMQRVTVAK